MPDGPRQAGIFLFDQFEELDAVGPYEVLAAWSANLEDGWSVTTMSFGGVDVRGAKGIRPHMAVEDAPELDLLVYPGGQGTDPCSPPRATSTGCARGLAAGRVPHDSAEARCELVFERDEVVSLGPVG